LLRGFVKNAQRESNMGRKPEMGLPRITEIKGGVLRSLLKAVGKRNVWGVNYLPAQERKKKG